MNSRLNDQGTTRRAGRRVTGCEATARIEVPAGRGPRDRPVPMSRRADSDQARPLATSESVTGTGGRERRRGLHPGPSGRAGRRGERLLIGTGIGTGKCQSRAACRPYRPVCYDSESPLQDNIRSLRSAGALAGCGGMLPAKETTSSQCR